MCDTCSAISARRKMSKLVNMNKCLKNGDLDKVKCMKKRSQVKLLRKFPKSAQPFFAISPP